MIYDLAMPRKDFDSVNEVVKDVTKSCKPRELVLITQDLTKLGRENKEYIETNANVLGVTFLDRSAAEFDIWIHPCHQYWDSPWTLDTLLHELTHGYAGAMDHGQHFRRMFVRSLYRYERDVGPVRADYMARRTVNRYSQDEWATRQLELEFSKKEGLRAKSLVSNVA